MLAGPVILESFEKEIQKIGIILQSFVVPELTGKVNGIEVGSLQIIVSRCIAVAL